MKKTLNEKIQIVNSLIGVGNKNTCKEEINILDIQDIIVHLAGYYCATETIDFTMNLVKRFIEKENIKVRFVELDLLEQAINTGWDMNKYKLFRLKQLKKEYKEYVK